MTTGRRGRRETRMPRLRCSLLKIDPLFQGIALGAIILLAVGFDAWSRLRRR
ncbi:hypothetical protein [Microbacterium schleiferi]|uniref:hypothetical protein n=1 Tax=Microbacterium schleiferi TaxID=69362 RepID=UPI001D177F8E|nr:hypothetical protein [Microbacterium schleiferi]MCC4266650.1 hypothetical protein [Microbacterium schleiferi]MEC8761645.1 hypothetical protein [Actinomycetota bacterium]